VPDAHLWLFSGLLEMRKRKAGNLVWRHQQQLAIWAQPWRQTQGVAAGTSPLKASSHRSSALATTLN